jgi:hypothetical protein
MDSKSSASFQQTVTPGVDQAPSATRKVEAPEIICGGPTPGKQIMRQGIKEKVKTYPFGHGESVRHRAQNQWHQENHNGTEVDLAIHKV